MNEIGSLEWFQETALESLTEIEPGYWDYSNSSVIWTPENSDAYEALQKDEGDDSYKSAVTDTEKLFIEKVAPKIVESLPNKFHYIDFGPGTEHKEKYLLEAIKSQGKEILYVPVDISKQMLDIANGFVQEMGFNTHPIHQTFENISAVLKNLEPGFRFISLGLTFANYAPQQILEILDSAMNQNGAAFIVVQLRDRVDMETIRKTYENSVGQKMILNKLKLIGLNQDDVEKIEASDEVEITCVIKNTSSMLEKIGVKSGDRVLLLRSYRYALDTIKQELSSFDVEYFDEDMEYLGCKIKATNSAK